MAPRLIFILDDVPALRALPEGSTFVSATGPLLPWRLARPLLKRLGIRGAIKAVLKLATPARRYYAVVERAAIVSDGWILIDRCDAYLIPAGACVIGPIWTAPSQRGRGLASGALSHAVTWCFQEGQSRIYIDTSPENVASQRTIYAVGFHPVNVS